MRVRQSTVAAAVALLLGAGGVAQATTLAIWTLEPESSYPWRPDPYFGAQSGNSYDILHNESVDFIGYKHSGSSTETLNGGHLVYRWRIDFSEPVDIAQITMTGFGDNSTAAVMRLLDVNKRLIVQKPLVGLNVMNQTVMSVPAGYARGTTFYYDEFDVSWDGRFRYNLQVVANALTNQCRLQ